MAKVNLLNSNVLMYPDENLIPYACYLDRQTILSKNADLIMSFKIPSLVSNQSKIDLFDIRDTFRLVLMEYFKNQNMSFYFTTVRKKADIIPFGEDKNYFTQQISNIWNKQNNWYEQFVNEIYITVILTPDINTNLFNPIFFLKSLTESGVRSIYSKKIDSAHRILKKFASNIVEKLSNYDIRILSMKEDKTGLIYSEHLKFFSILMNLEKGNFPISYDNLSDVLRLKKIFYGSDIIEVDKKGEKKFASVLSVKSFQDMSLNQIDRILQLPIEFVITETATFVDNKFVVSLYNTQKDIITLSEDLDLAYISGLDAMVSNNTGKNIDYCLAQNTIMVMNNSKNELINDLKKLYKALDDIGLVAVKENVYLPTVFWSQLPGNFRYLRRLHIVPSNKLANYISLFNFPVGKLRYNHWGNAITIVPTALNTPYFFNFHNGNNGNTIIVGLPKSGKTTIMNFLLSQTSKIEPRIFYIDTQRSSEVFINAMGGKYYKISPNLSEDETFQMNPFMIDNSPNNQEFLRKFIINLVDFQDDGFIEMGKTLTQLKSQYEHIPNIISSIFAIPFSERIFEKIANLFNTPKTNLIFNKLSPWYKKEQISFIFNHKTNTKIENKIIGISLRTIIENKNLTIPAVDYLFHIVNNLANGEPFILAIDNAWQIVDNKYIAPIFKKMLEISSSKNIAMLLTTDGLSKLTETFISQPLTEYFGTEIYLENPKVGSYQKRIFSLQDEEIKILSLMKIEDHNFILKCINDVVISSINLKDFAFYTNIFSNDNISINAMKKAKETAKSNEAKLWIPIFLQILEEYQKALFMKRNNQNEINQLKWEESKSNENDKNKIINNN